MGKDTRGPLYYSWWTAPRMPEKGFRKGLGNFLKDQGFETGFLGRGPLSRGGVVVEITSKEVKHQRTTDVRVYAAPNEDPEALELLREEMGKHIYSMADVNNKFYGDYWEDKATQNPTDSE